MILQNFDLFPYSTSDGEKSNSPSILKARREELGLSQQQVAQGAELLLKQYQRLEVGERLIEGASLKTALAIWIMQMFLSMVTVKGVPSMEVLSLT